jgi:hypothetical protein
MTNLAATTDRIHVLLDGIERGDHLDRPHLEETLTDGYACALTLDAECRRLERCISVRAERLAYGSGKNEARELSALARLLTRRRGELDALRNLLAVLKSGAREPRVA